MEGMNIYLSVFPEFFVLLSFCLLKLTKTEFAGNESDDSVITLMIDRLVYKDLYHFEYSRFEC